jgi:hypothetical protein
MSRLSTFAAGLAAIALVFTASCKKHADIGSHAEPSGARGAESTAEATPPAAGAAPATPPADPAAAGSAVGSAGAGLAEGRMSAASSDGARGRAAGAAPGDRPTSPPVDADKQREAAPGRLTAGDWDDNLNFSFFRSYLDGVRSERPDLPAVSLAERVTIRVTDERGAPVRHALVQVRSGDHVCLAAPAGTDGRLLFFPAHDCGQHPGRLTVTAARSEQADPVALAAPAGDTWTIALPGGGAAAPPALDLALLIDATGSMGDEIAYLQEEARGIVESVRAAAPGVSLRFALVVYRDRGDDYVTRVFPFTGDLDAFRRDLSAQSAGGGGDYPEALDQGIGALADLAWRGGDVARVAFLIADAPPHTDRAGAYLRGVDQLRRRGVHVYPVGASGVADEAEYLFRVTAALTQARYLFLTDDSGIGSAHAEPHIPCYAVQRLDDLLRRMVLFELTGESTAPRTVLRTVGDPVDGRCSLSAGRVVLMAH